MSVGLQARSVGLVTAIQARLNSWRSRSAALAGRTFGFIQAVTTLSAIDAQLIGLTSEVLIQVLFSDASQLLYKTYIQMTTICNCFDR